MHWLALVSGSLGISCRKFSSSGGVCGTVASAQNVAVEAGVPICVGAGTEPECY